MIKNLVTKDFEDKVLKIKKPIMVKFTTKTCNPCKIFAPTYEELAKENKHIKFYQIDAEEEHTLAVEYDLRSVPTVMLFNNGEYLDRLSGGLNKEKVEDMIKDLK